MKYFYLPGLEFNGTEFCELLEGNEAGALNIFHLALKRRYF